MLVAFFGPPIWLGWRRQRRCETIDIVLPNFLDRLNLSMDAGLGFEIALRRTSENFPGLLGLELRKLVRAVDRGHTRFEALDQFVERTPSNDLAAFVTAVKQSDRLGTSLAKTLRIQSQILRARRRRRAEEAGRRLPILIVFPLVFFFLPALLIIYLAPPMLHLFLGR
jgi:tight adherence protein C